MARARSDDDAVRITTASASRHEDIRRRQRRYLASMSLRTICFVGAVIVGEGLAMWLLIFGAIFLPYVAVVMANAVTSRSDAFELRGPTGAHAELESGAGRGAIPPGSSA